MICSSFGFPYKVGGKYKSWTGLCLQAPFFLSQNTNFFHLTLYTDTSKKAQAGLCAMSIWKTAQGIPYVHTSTLQAADFHSWLSLSGTGTESGWTVVARGFVCTCLFCQEAAQESGIRSLFKGNAGVWCCVVQEEQLPRQGLVRTDSPTGQSCWFRGKLPKEQQPLLSPWDVHARWLPSRVTCGMAVRAHFLVGLAMDPVTALWRTQARREATWFRSLTF